MARLLGFCWFSFEYRISSTVHVYILIIQLALAIEIHVDNTMSIIQFNFFFANYRYIYTLNQVLLLKYSMLCGVYLRCCVNNMLFYIIFFLKCTIIYYAPYLIFDQNTLKHLCSTKHNQYVILTVHINVSI